MNNSQYLHQALQWKYNGPFELTTSFRRGGYVIDIWGSQSIQPDPSEFQGIIDDYIAQVITPDKAQRRERKQAIVAKLGMNKSDINALVELIEDKNDN